jgi:hypothetical protein
MPHTKLVQVMDREADFFELFDDWSKGARRTHLLIRAMHDRRTTANESCSMRSGPRPLVSSFSFTSAGKALGPKRASRRLVPKRDERVAEMTLRYRAVELPPPPLSA